MTLVNMVWFVIHQQQSTQSKLHCQCMMTQGKQANEYKWVVQMRTSLLSSTQLGFSLQFKFRKITLKLATFVISYMQAMKMVNIVNSYEYILCITVPKSKFWSPTLLCTHLVNANYVNIFLLIWHWLSYKSQILRPSITASKWLEIEFRRTKSRICFLDTTSKYSGWTVWQNDPVQPRTMGLRSLPKLLPHGKNDYFWHFFLDSTDHCSKSIWATHFKFSKMLYTDKLTQIISVVISLEHVLM